MNVSLSDLYNSAAKSPEDKSEAETEDKTSEEKPEEEKEPVEKTEEGETEKKDEAATEEAAAEHKKKFKLPNIPKALKNIRSKSKEREKNKVRNEVFCYSFRNYYCLKEKC